MRFDRSYDRDFELKIVHDIFIYENMKTILSSLLFIIIMLIIKNGFSKSYLQIFSLCVLIKN